MKLAILLDEILSRKASQAHLVIDEEPAFRVDGPLVRGEMGAVTERDIEEMFIQHLSDEQRDLFLSRGYVELTLRHGDRRFYCHIARERGRTMVTVLTLPTDVKSLDELVENEEDLGRLLQVLQFRKGLVIVTGTTGSGKTTLCASMLETVNRTQAKRIITIESPVEFDLVSKKSLITQQMIGHDYESFPDAIASALGSYADIVYISELRDFHSYELAFALAESGQLVLTTMNQPTTSACIKYLNDAYPSDRERTRELAISGLQAIVATQLVPRANSTKDRIGAYEVLIATQRVRGLIMEGKFDVMNILRQDRPIGMQPMDDSLVRLFKSKLITHDEARHRVLQKDVLPQVV